MTYCDEYNPLRMKQSIFQTRRLVKLIQNGKNLMNREMNNNKKTKKS